MKIISYIRDASAGQVELVGGCLLLLSAEEINIDNFLDDEVEAVGGDTIPFPLGPKGYQPNGSEGVGIIGTAEDAPFIGEN